MGTPTKLGKYVLAPEPLGQGAMGVVYKGFDPDLRHAVAIKVIRRELVEGPGGEPMRQRFKNEAIAGRRLRHPNIVPVYEYGEDEDCSHIVMAFVEGRPLKEALDAGPRPSVSECSPSRGSSSMPCSMPIATTWCIGISNPPTSWSAPMASSTSPISGSRRSTWRISPGPARSWAPRPICPPSSARRHRRTTARISSRRGSSSMSS